MVGRTVRRLFPTVLPVLMAIISTVTGIADAARVHDVELLFRVVEGKDTPEFYFEPTGLYIEPGDTVRFIAVTADHTVTAYHRDFGKVHRVPEGVEAFTSDVLPLDAVWEYTFVIPGIYDLWCLPHEFYGHVMRLVVGEASGPALEPPTDFGPKGTPGAAGKILSHPTLDPFLIIERGVIAWDDIPTEAKTVSDPN